MERLTYKQAEDRIFKAYFKDEIQPYNPDFCFCGSLCDNKRDWYSKAAYAIGWHFDFYGYSGSDFYKMEFALLDRISEISENDENYEDALFEGMSAALDVLKQIHLERGEIIDEPIETFKKRELAPTQ